MGNRERTKHRLKYLSLFPLIGPIGPGSPRLSKQKIPNYRGQRVNILTRCAPNNALQTNGKTIIGNHEKIIGDHRKS